jgi:hypothetical protein
MGRYVALAIFLMVLAICSAPMFMLGVGIAGASSAVRQLVGMRKTLDTYRTKLYDRTNDAIGLDEIERILIQESAPGPCSSDSL